MTTALCYGIDAGGSHTRVRFDDGTPHGALLTYGSVNPAAVGDDLADQTIRTIYRRLREVANTRKPVGWLASACADERSAGSLIKRTYIAAAATGLAGTMMLSNDIVPLLLAPPRSGYGVVVVVGTGSGFLAGDGRGRWARAGGYEYLASDEGSAFALALAGLRAAAQSLDGRGPATLLLDGFEQAAGRMLPDLARDLATESRPKSTVAQLAPVVCTAWLRGDEVAATIVSGAIDALVAGADTVSRRLGLTTTAPVVLTGGVVNGCPEFSRALSEALHDRHGLEVERIASDGAADALELAHLVNQEAPGIGIIDQARTGGLAWSTELTGEFEIDLVGDDCA